MLAEFRRNRVLRRGRRPAASPVRALAGRSRPLSPATSAVLWLLIFAAAGVVYQLNNGGFVLRLPEIGERTTAAAVFSLCDRGGTSNCVIDGDTFRYQGQRIRIMDIDAPETHPPRCAYERDLGARATRRLHQLLNAGPFVLRAGFRDEDQYGRKLRTVSRDGRSIGDILVSEGLARDYDGARRSWCDA
jgi:micrococcal nuclease